MNAGDVASPDSGGGAGSGGSGCAYDTVARSISANGESAGGGAAIDPPAAVAAAMAAAAAMRSCRETSQPGRDVAGGGGNGREGRSG